MNKLFCRLSLKTFVEYFLHIYLNNLAVNSRILNGKTFHVLCSWWRDSSPIQKQRPSAMIHKRMASSAVQTAQELLEFVTFGEARCSL